MYRIINTMSLYIAVFVLSIIAIIKGVYDFVS